jgi:hypothetical protein
MGRRWRRVAALSALAGVTLWGRAAAASPDDHRVQSWLGLFTHAPVRRNLWIWSDFHLRAYESFEPTTFILRPGLSWRARPNLFLTAGYAWTPGWTRTDAPRQWGDLTLVDEHRSWQQLLWTPNDRDTGLAAQVRGRLEQRFRPGEGEVGSRLRVLWRGQAPISRDLDRTWIVVVWNELFLGLNETQWGQARGFDQNRAFGGVGWQAVPRRLRLEFGYMNKWAAREGPDPIDHVIMLNMFFGW